LVEDETTSLSTEEDEPKALSTEKDFLVDRFGEVLDLGRCLVGRSLNLLTIRGYARLDQLAAISAPDVFDQKQNPNGTQRNLTPLHAREAFEYAMDASDMLPEESPRCFPEIILNARDTNIIDLYSVDDEDEHYEFDSFSTDFEEAIGIVGLRIRIKDLEFPKPDFNPQVSRVDGNHRLSRTDDLLREGLTSEDDVLSREFPSLGFMLVLELSDLQEASLFRDINGEQRGMEVAHLDSIVLRTVDPEVLKKDPKRRALWIANELAQPGRAWEDMVFFGGSHKGVKSDLGYVPPVTINALKATIDQQIRSAPTVDAAFKDNPNAIVVLLDRFWKAVRETFPEAWQNKRDYILLQAIGLGAFARFGGTIIERGLNDKRYSQADFQRHLEVVRGRVPLDRDHELWRGVAGAGGQKVVADALIAAAEPDLVKLEEIKKDLSDEPDIDTLLDEAEDATEAKELEE
jgi:hypothetical protein